MIGQSLKEEDEQKLWDELHLDGAQKLHGIVGDLKGFYVKAAQIVSTQQRLFPKQYTDTLNSFTDNLDPMPLPVAKAVVQQELLAAKNKAFEDVFQEFDAEPLGAASIAQVHRAVLTDTYGGHEVAVKIQRPSIESKLLGDIANLKAVSKVFRNVDALPIDYYPIFSELEEQLADEFDFEVEAAAMDRIYGSLIINIDGVTEMTTQLPITLPRPVPGLVSRRVLVMDYLKGNSLSRAQENMKQQGISANRPEAKIIGRKILKALTVTFGRSILENGFFHADAHPGNIFILENGDVGLIDFGQVKQIPEEEQEILAKLMIALDERQENGTPEDLEKISALAFDLGVEVNDGAKREAAAAFVIWLFDGSAQNLPGGYDLHELSSNSPLRDLKTFPPDLVLVARSTILIKALSNRFGITWNLSKEWAPIARQIVNRKSADIRSNKIFSPKRSSNPWNLLSPFKRSFAALKIIANRIATGFFKRLPSPLRRIIASFFC